MTYQDNIEAVINSIKFEKPIFDVLVSDTELEAKPKSWRANLDESSMINRYVNRFAIRTYNGHTKKFIIHTAELIEDVNRDLVADIINIFLNCSPYDMPRRTKAYKAFRKVVAENTKNIKFLDSIFNISEYYTNNTTTGSIQNKDDGVHRKNIYHLLCLMEKSYGKTEKTNIK